MSRSTTIATTAAALGAVAVLATGCELGDVAASSGEPRSITDPAATTISEVQTAQERLAGLTVAPAGSMSGYDREDRFGGWETFSGCDTRAEVLMRDGEGVRTNEHCTVTGGSWTGVYSGETVTDPSELDIDHVVALGDAWRSGADEWTDHQRQVFANSMHNLAVTDASLNRERGDAGPSEWMPPAETGQCELAVTYIQVKSDFDLTVTAQDRHALSDTLEGCPAST